MPNHKISTSARVRGGCTPLEPSNHIPCQLLITSSRPLHLALTYGSKVTPVGVLQLLPGMNRDFIVLHTMCNQTLTHPCIVLP